MAEQPKQTIMEILIILNNNITVLSKTINNLSDMINVMYKELELNTHACAAMYQIGLSRGYFTQREFYVNFNQCISKNEQWKAQERDKPRETE